MTTLTTFSDLPIASPLAGSVELLGEAKPRTNSQAERSSALNLSSAIASSLPPEQQVQTAGERVGLAEIADRGLLNIRGRDAEGMLSSLYTTPEMKIGDVVTLQDGLLARLRRDEYALLTHDLRDTMDRLARVTASQRVTLTDITHGRCGMLLAGAYSQEVVPKICTLDFSERHFPTLHAAQTSLAKARTLIIRADIEEIPAYGLFVDRSLAAYVWEVVCDTAQEFGGIALSQDALQHLRKMSLW
jgi:heterotetrameric sarcosine oxidase gamma subunit